LHGWRRIDESSPRYADARSPRPCDLGIASSRRRAQARRTVQREEIVVPDTSIRTFEVEVPDDELAELRRRIAATRFPHRELVAERSQGVQLATMQEVARYWEHEYDWRRCEARLNALPQFLTEIDGVDVHFIHVKSPHDDALPLIMTHGWPGSVIE